jgi:hypothetical protein
MSEQDTSKKLDLLPCPFCGGKAGEARWPMHVGCLNEQCGAFAANLTVAQWNTRAAHEPEEGR